MITLLTVIGSVFAGSIGALVLLVTLPLAPLATLAIPLSLRY